MWLCERDDGECWTCTHSSSTGPSIVIGILHHLTAGPFSIQVTAWTVNSAFFLYRNSSCLFHPSVGKPRIWLDSKPCPASTRPPQNTRDKRHQHQHRPSNIPTRWCIVYLFPLPLELHDAKDVCISPLTLLTKTPRTPRPLQKRQTISPLLMPPPQCEIY